MAEKNIITLHYRGRIAIITINRPERLNALSSNSYYLLAEKFREVEKREDVCITILTGTGRFFSAGADVSGVEPTGTIDLGEKRRQFVSSLAVNNLDFSRTIYMHPKILIVALNGPAVGLSAAIIAHADFIYAAPHAYVLTPFSSLGLVAEGGASRAFVKRLGISKANKALLMGKRIQSEELLSTGFIDKIISVASGSQDDSEGFLKAVLAEVDDALGPHLHDWSLLKTKELIRQPEREILDKQNILEMYGALHTLVAGIPQEEFRKLATGQKKHKL